MSLQAHHWQELIRAASDAKDWPMLDAILQHPEYIEFLASSEKPRAMVIPEKILILMDRLGPAPERQKLKLR